MDMDSWWLLKEKWISVSGYTMKRLRYYETMDNIPSFLLVGRFNIFCFRWIPTSEVMTCAQTTTPCIFFFSSVSMIFIDILFIHTVGSIWSLYNHIVPQFHVEFSHVHIQATYARLSPWHPMKIHVHRRYFGLAPLFFWYHLRQQNASMWYNWYHIPIVDGFFNPIWDPVWNPIKVPGKVTWNSHSNPIIIPLNPLKSQ